MRQPAWDVYETVILIDTYYKMLSGDIKKRDAIKNVSDLLRKRAVNRGLNIDQTFRNEAGIKMRFEEISYVDSNSSKGLRNTSKLFRETVKMYKKDRDSFNSVLNVALSQVDGRIFSDSIAPVDKRDNTLENESLCKQESNDGSKEDFDYYIDSLNKIVKWLGIKYTVKLSYDYLSDPNKARNDMLYRVYRDGKDIMWVYFIFSQRSRYISFETEPEYVSTVDFEKLHSDRIQIRKSHPCQKMFFSEFEKIEESLALICEAIEQYFTVSLNNNSLNTCTTCVNASLASSWDDSSYVKKVEEAVLSADLEGITVEELSRVVPNSSILSLKRACDISKKIIDLSEVMIHVDAVVDLDDAALKLHEIIEKLLNKNSGYVSSSQFFEYSRAELQMFLNDNDMCSEQKVYYFANFLFSKINWHGYHYEFTSGKHISRNGESVLRTNLDVFEKYARDKGGVFLWDDLMDYLDKVGIKSGNLRGQMKIGSEPIFFYVTSEKLITVESMNIDDAWMNKMRISLQKLFNDVGDHIIVRNISPFWYEQLPELPQRLQWTPILLQYVIHFFGEKLDARTIYSELNVQYDSIHCLLVRSDSVLRSFGDAVIAYIVDNEISERHFYEGELRRLLSYGKLIGNRELIDNLQRAIGNDSRFAWDASGETVTVLL